MSGCGEGTTEAEPVRVLFVCARNRWRSPTAERIYSDDPRMRVRSAGLSKGSRRTVTEADLRWADVVLVMEREHARRLRERFGRDALPDVRCLSIPDRWKFMDPELVKRLREAVERELPEVGSGWCFESGTADGGRGRPG